MLSLTGVIGQETCRLSPGMSSPSPLTFNPLLQLGSRPQPRVLGPIQLTRAAGLLSTCAPTCTVGTGC